MINNTEATKSHGLLSGEMKFNDDGIVIRVQNTGEANRIVTVLTRKNGLLRAFAMGARSTKSRLQSGTALFAYCSFLFDEKKDVYTIREAEIKNVFFDLRYSIENLTLAQYFCEVALKIVSADRTDDEYLRLLLNSLHFLCAGSPSPKLIKAVYELRIAAISGYMPNLIACNSCGEYETDIMYFDHSEGILFCSQCGSQSPFTPLPLPVIQAMRHIVFSEFSNIFSFSLSETLIDTLSGCTEKHLLLSTGEHFLLLEFYKSVCK